MYPAANDKPSLPALGVSTAFPPGQALHCTAPAFGIDRGLNSQRRRTPRLYPAVALFDSCELPAKLRQMLRQFSLCRHTIPVHSEFTSSSAAGSTSNVWIVLASNLRPSSFVPAHARLSVSIPFSIKCLFSLFCFSASRYRSSGRSRPRCRARRSRLAPGSVTIDRHLIFSHHPERDLNDPDSVQQDGFVV